MEVDPEASLRIWGVEFDLAGRSVEIPPLPASDWLPVIMNGDLLTILDMVDSSSEVDELIISPEIEGGELTRVLTSVIEQVSGRPLQAALTLGQVLRLRWVDINGSMVLQGFRWDQVSLSAALDAVYAFLASRLDKEKLDQLDTVMNGEVRPDGKIRPNRKKAVEDFEAMAGPRPSPSPSPASAGPSADGPPKTPPRSQPRLRAAP